MNFHADTSSLLKQTELQRDLSRFAERQQQDDSSSCKGVSSYIFVISSLPPASFVRFAESRNLGEIGNTKAILYLQPLLKDKNAYVKQAASTALEMF